MYYRRNYDSPLGEMILVGEDKNIVGLWFAGEKYFGETIDGEMIEDTGNAVFADAVKWLDEYFAGGQPDISGLSLAPKGSPFRRMIWDMLMEIPYGEVTTYGRLAAMAAERMGKKSMAAQAVGGAVGHNPISVIIPCHRVIGSDGSLTGYAGGVDKKLGLLRLEGAIL